MERPCTCTYTKFGNIIRWISFWWLCVIILIKSQNNFHTTWVNWNVFITMRTANVIFNFSRVYWHLVFDNIPKTLTTSLKKLLVRNGIQPFSSFLLVHSLPIYGSLILHQVSAYTWFVWHKYDKEFFFLKIMTLFTYIITLGMDLWVIKDQSVA